MSPTSPTRTPDKKRKASDALDVKGSQSGRKADARGAAGTPDKRRKAEGGKADGRSAQRNAVSETSSPVATPQTTRRSHGAAASPSTTTSSSKGRGAPASPAVSRRNAHPVSPPAPAAMGRPVESFEPSARPGPSAGRRGGGVDEVTKRLRLDEVEVVTASGDSRIAAGGAVGLLLLAMGMYLVGDKDAVKVVMDFGGLFLLLGSWWLFVGSDKKKGAGGGGGLARRRSVSLDDHIRRSSLSG